MGQAFYHALLCLKLATAQIARLTSHLDGGMAGEHESNRSHVICQQSSYNHTDITRQYVTIRASTDYVRYD